MRLDVFRIESHEISHVTALFNPTVFLWLDSPRR